MKTRIQSREALMSTAEPADGARRTRPERGRRIHARTDVIPDAGFSLLEAVFAGLVLMIFAAGVFGIIGATLKVSKIDRQRVAGSSLAAREMEITRNQFRASDSAVLALIGQGTATNPDPTGGAGVSVIDGVQYTVKRTAEWLASGTGVSPCDGGGAVTYPAVSVNVEVSWLGIGSVAPVLSNSIVTPNKSLLNSVTSFVAVKVVDYAGKPEDNRPVKMSGPAGTYSIETDESGCAVFGLGSTGNHVFSVNEPGYVDFHSVTPVQQTVPVTASSFKQVQFTWDRAVTINAAIVAPAGFALPLTLPSLTAYNTGLPATGTPLYSRTAPATSFSSTTLSGFGPYPTGVGLWAGGCSDASPAGSPTNGTLTNVVTPAGGTSSTAITLGALDVTGPPGLLVTATKSGSTCNSSSDLYVVLGTTDATGRLRTSLPFGTWTLSRPFGAPSSIAHANQGPYTMANPVTTVNVP